MEGKVVVWKSGNRATGGVRFGLLLLPMLFSGFFGLFSPCLLVFARGWVEILLYWRVRVGWVRGAK